jgi:hypothetical protein
MGSKRDHEIQEYGALEAENSLEEDAAVTSSGRAEKAASKRLRFAKKLRGKRAIWRTEILMVEDILARCDEGEVIFVRRACVQTSETALIPA